MGVTGVGGNGTEKWTMAQQNRRDIFAAQEVGVFHCIQRVVRASWLCGVDQRTGVSYEH